MERSGNVYSYICVPFCWPVPVPVKPRPVLVHAVKHPKISKPGTLVVLAPAAEEETTTVRDI